MQFGFLKLRWKVGGTDKEHGYCVAYIPCLEITQAMAGMSRHKRYMAVSSGRAFAKMALLIRIWRSIS